MTLFVWVKFLLLKEGDYYSNKNSNNVLILLFVLLLLLLLPIYSRSFKTSPPMHSTPVWLSINDYMNMEEAGTKNSSDKYITKYDTALTHHK